MKKVLKSRLFIAIITAIICITGTAYAAGQIFASDITYKETTVDKVLDDLYDVANNPNCVKGSFVWTQENKENGKVIVNFTPSVFAIYAINNYNHQVYYYNTSINSQKIYHFTIAEESAPFEMFNFGTSIRNDNKLELRFTSAAWIGNNFYYMVCK